MTWVGTNQKFQTNEKVKLINRSLKYSSEQLLNLSMLQIFISDWPMEQHTLKNVNNCLNTNIYSYLETSGSQSANPGSAITNGREPRSCLGRVFNSKLGHSATLVNKCMVCMQPLLKLKTRPKDRPS